MEKIMFNKDWYCHSKGKAAQKIQVELPHDAMLLDEKNENSPSNINNGWYDTQDYTYEKSFYVPEDYQAKKMMFEFEGVYHKASVYLNEQKVAYHSYGYTGFYVDVSDVVNYGTDNTIRVEAVNSDQPNSRWYSGTGIYRPVWLYVLPKEHIELEGIKITTLDYQNPKIKVAVTTTNSGPIKLEILDKNNVIATVEGLTEGYYVNDIDLPQGKLWSIAHPNLYDCRVTYGDHCQTERFGIRVVDCNATDGLTINGERVILRGACIHHDNGLLGACAYDFAEDRKVRILQENGYNAIRSAHNPCSKALLRACDERGMLLVDEYVDVWYIHKTKYDYASEVEENYREDLKRIVNKDYNHPSVIMYSTGNEVSETAQTRGIQLCQDLTNRLHELDGTRPVTCGINIFFNFLSSIGFGVYTDKKADAAVEKASKKKAVGSEFYNTIAGLFGSDFMKFGATLYPCDVKTRDAFANMDVAGYNYGIRRYRKDLKKYPNRLILGTETFCADAYAFWEQAKQHKRIIGDFVWAGMDYLGEVGIGAWEYKDYAPDFSHGVGWVSAGSGRIDLTGKPLAEMRYTQVAFEEKDIAIGVIPVYQANEAHSPSAWKMTNAMESWSWRGCNGQKTKVEVYARAHSISLFVNNECVGTKKTKNDCKVIFDTMYQDGELRAEAYDEHNHKIAETTLRTAAEKTVLTLEPEQMTIKGATDLAYVRLKFTDEQGITQPMARGDIHVSVEGGELLGLGSACPYYTKSYLGDTCDTYYGEALAIIKPTSDTIRVNAQSELGKGAVEINVE